MFAPAQCYPLVLILGCILIGSAVISVRRLGENDTASTLTRPISHDAAFDITENIANASIDRDPASNPVEKRPSENKNEFFTIKNDAPTSKCTNGPYVFDPNPHVEGIGSTFQHRKYSLILADALNARWIGELYNSHARKEGNQAQTLFGLGDPNCTASDLETNSANLNFIRLDRPLDKVNVSSSENRKMIREKEYFAEKEDAKHEYPSIWSLCGYVEEDRNLMPRMNPNTVLILDYKSTWRKDANYCLFNSRFRKRFEMRQRQREVRTKKKDEEIWISLHFRWGDVATESVDSPNNRTGAGLSQYVNETRLRLEEQQRQNKTVTIHFFSEGDAETFDKFQAAFPNAKMHINEDWVDSLDIMTQSNVLIGGESGFFVLAAHLCRDCTIVTAYPWHPKFRARGVERNLTNYRKATGFLSRK